MKNALNDFKILKVTKLQLQDMIGENLHNVKIKKPVTINNTDVVFILERVRNNEISISDLIDWVNVIWFTNLFIYADKYQDSIASVMSELEELDEEGNQLTCKNIVGYIDARKNNREID